MHITIIGGGAIGYPLAQGLAEHHDVFVVDVDPARAERFADLDVELVTGGGTNPDVLRRAGAEGCDVFIGATRHDEINIVACSLGSQLGARRTICFVTSENFLNEHGGDESLRRHFGIDQVVWPEAELAADIERIIREPDATDAAVLAGGRIQLLEFRLAADSPLAGRDVASLELPPGVVIVALKHDDSTSIPRGLTRLAAGDRVVLMGTREGMAQSRLQVSPGVRPRSQLVTIVGGGDVGYRLAQRLDGAGGIRLRVIERDRQRGELLASALQNALVLCGDGTDLELLEAEDIGRSDVLVSVIDNDERNLFASILGRQLGVRKVITRVGNWRNHRLFERVGVDVALSARGSAVTSVVHRIDGGRAVLLAVLQEGQVRVLDVAVPQGFASAALKDLGLPEGAIIGTVLRGMDVVVPRGDDRVQGGDHLLICCTEAAAGGVRPVRTQTYDLTVALGVAKLLRRVQSESPCASASSPRSRVGSSGCSARRFWPRRPSPRATASGQTWAASSRAAPPPPWPGSCWSVSRTGPATTCAG